MKGPRPPQAHLAAHWDHAQEIGRTDVTDVIEAAIDNIEASRRFYPDLYAHLITQALIDAGLIKPTPQPSADPIPAPDYTVRVGWAHAPLPDRSTRRVVVDCL